MPRLLLVVVVALTAASGRAHGDEGRRFVIAAGGDSSVFVAEQSGGEAAALGYFGRLSWETPVPAYTSKDKGYRWNLGIDPDMEFSRSWRELGDEMTMLEAGLRVSAPFSQKRMGLLEVSARGGFWLALRGGMSAMGATSPSQRGEFVYRGPQASSPMQPQRNGMLLDLAVGEYVLLGDSGLRIELEMSTLMAEQSELFGGANFGIRMRAGLGAYF